MIDFRQIVTIGAGVLTLITGLNAAWYWYRSSVVSAQEFDQDWASYDDGLSVHVIMAEMNIGGTRKAMADSCGLNVIASRWTGASALLGAITTFTGMFH